MKPVRPLLWQSGKRINLYFFKAIKHKRYWWFRRENTAPLVTFYCWNSNLHIYIVKPLEKHINEHVMKHFLVNDLFYQKQSGFRPNHSCHTALTELIDTWLSEININKLCGALFIDFAKAFDVINHDLLLRKLTLYCLSANTLSLICSFFNSRLQKVSLEDNQSDFKTVLFGIPQGSV